MIVLVLCVSLRSTAEFVTLLPSSWYTDKNSVNPVGPSKGEDHQGEKH